MATIPGMVAGKAFDAAALKARKKQLSKGATYDQKKALDYFIPEGCKAIFGRVKDEEYDEIVKKLISQSNHEARAYNKVGVDPDELKEIDPVFFWGYDDDKAEFTTTTSAGYFRSNRIELTHLFFSSTQVFLYVLSIDTVKNEMTEHTEEYFYRDITNFATSTDSRETFRSKGCLGKMERVPTTVQRFSLVVPGDKFWCSTSQNIDNQVKAMKNKLREMKNV